VTADPEPENSIRDLHAQRPVVQPDPNRAKSSDAFEMERRVSGIGLKQLEALIS